eukprot:TRINITY_DN13838_c0_g1_i1.p1 TRINITY_DN13838_c0_g1~~TRINITY_DN13838_c0_g1_i1.p1  ORF type:complete len:378 (-),score=58.37 TRINITY_DN13838_c0_g1_i1:35-1168(-)
MVFRESTQRKPPLPRHEIEDEEIDIDSTKKKLFRWRFPAWITTRHAQAAFCVWLLLLLGAWWYDSTYSLQPRKTTKPLENRVRSQEDDETTLKIPKKKYIFCINPGRSGSQYLSLLLREARINSFHEPEPRVTGEFLQTVLEQGINHTTQLERVLPKVQALLAVWKEIKNEERWMYQYVYAETSNMFIKTWYDVIDYINQFPGEWEFRIIILRRYLPLVVKSQYELGWFDPSHAQRGVWYYGLHDVAPDLRRIEPLRPEHNLTRFEQIIGYNLDIEYLTQQFIERYKHLTNVLIIPVRLEEISTDPSIVRRMFESMGAGVELQKLPAVQNQRSQAKKFNTTLKEAQEQVFRVINEYRQLGVKLPPLPHLERIDTETE